MTKVLIVYHSRSGNVAKMAAAVAEGAKEGGADVVVKEVDEATLEDLAAADGIILGGTHLLWDPLRRDEGLHRQIGEDSGQAGG